MNNSLGPGPVELRRIDALVRRSNAGLHPAITRFVDGGHRHIGETLRSAVPPDTVVQRFLGELQLMEDYVGTSYRVSQISRDGLAALQRSRGRYFVDLGVQCAFVLPSNAAAWAINAAQAQPRDGAYQLFSIFDESVPQKNLSTALLADHVIVPPATPLRLTGLRTIQGRGATGPGRPRIVAHFARADPACGTSYDLYNDARGT
ncbi:hypothetical protein R69927_07042 [Paraburkholderia domus]|uniref:Uncharacterized protein n=1 Tax=Paraburkholderia domus TaxID=2793075 RepID=A0A9N8R810_9BURK|nr:hypothetical protein [Paraburkholderia domus]MBK5064177.1 hypothetical protein [Burkholderia sp. R-70199]MBK5091175.1 hypothetical protein [Burkholderia sp. R-69927]MBK5169630.1 hypothetical protein [Burkholderia sp. R-70211]MBK5185291.1 hypothetical protein [Burkholderia sp. R-69749]MCI0150285.1 hypothetical protein [Paraburkholderia sediminicola]